MTIEDILNQKKTWLSMGDLVKLTNKDASALREELGELLKSGLIQKIGKKRGTKYATLMLEKPEENKIDIRESIIQILKEKKQTDRKTICEELNLYDAKIRPTILEMVDKEEICTNGKARGQLFWLPENDHFFKEDESSKKEESKSSRKSNNFENELEDKIAYKFKDVDELVQAALKVLPEKKRYDISELTDMISKTYPNDFDSLSILKYGIGNIRKKKDSVLKYEQIHDEFGRRFVYWIDRSCLK